jgi:hypothetical protein
MHFDWNPLQNNYFIKGEYNEEGFHLSITDFKSLWRQKADRTQLLADIKERFPQMEITESKLIPFLIQLVDGTDRTTAPTISRTDNMLTVSCKKSAGTIPFQWDFEFAIVNNPVELFEILIQPLLRLVMAYSAREARYCKGIEKMEERMSTMHDMFSLHGIQSGLQPLDPVSVDWNIEGVNFTEIDSIIPGLNIVSRPVEKLHVEASNPASVIPEPEKSDGIEEKRKRRAELLKQSQKNPKKKRIF